MYWQENRPHLNRIFQAFSRKFDSNLIDLPEFELLVQKKIKSVYYQYDIMRFIERAGGRPSSSPTNSVFFRQY